MEPNLSGLDRFVHILVGGGICVLAFTGGEAVLAIFGVVPLGSGFLGHDPIYKLLGKSTRKKGQASPFGRYTESESNKRSWRSNKR